MRFYLTTLYSHRDLKPENILLEDSSDTAIKLIDFGFAKHVALGDVGVQGLRGSLGYIAPEVLNNSIYNYKVCSHKP